ncbi:hypothetical protein FACS18948_3920 [Clostridia bacterium]|nr:hypothetical protein FACS1894184_03160 [Clostridia bacterium]GHV27101.1 hypothetical protein FACS18948_3920 [Clostridia bacterium]
MRNGLTILSHTLLAALGALARQLNLKDTQSMKVIQFLSGCLIAMFAGAMVYFLAQYLKLESNLSFALAGISGWVGPQILDSIASVITKAAGLKKEDDKK